MQLQEKLFELYDDYGLAYLKGGTEWEDMEYDEIEFLKNLDLSIPLLVKIAGPEARVDIRRLKGMGVESILGPLIESEYALEKFVTTVLEIYEGCEKNPSLAINIETISGVNNIDAIYNNKYFDLIDLVVIGRLDLATSMGFDNIDNPAVSEMTQEIVNKTHKKGKDVSVGGFVNPKSAKKIQDTFHINRMNTIHLMFDLDRVSNISESIEQGIRFEIDLYKNLKSINPRRAHFYEERIHISQKKLG